MARRHARGRTELYRLVKSIPLSRVVMPADPTAPLELPTTLKTVMYVDSIYAVMSDGKILKRNGARWSLAMLSPAAFGMTKATIKTITSEHFTSVMLTKGYVRMTEQEYHVAKRKAKTFTMVPPMHSELDSVPR